MSDSNIAGSALVRPALLPRHWLPTGIAPGAVPGLLLAVVVLSGRAGFSRLFPWSGDGPLSELRIWAILAYAFTVAIVCFAYAPTTTRPDRLDGSVAWATGGALLLLGWVATTLFWSPVPDVAWDKAYGMILIAVTLGLTYICAARTGAQGLRESFWVGLVGVGLILALLGVREVLAEGPSRLSVLGGGPNVFGRIMGLVCIGCLYFWRRYGKPLLWLPIGVLTSMLSVLSGSRGAMVALAAALVAFAIVERFSWRRIIPGLIIVSILGVLILLYTSLGQAVQTVYEKRVVELLFEEQYTSGRGNIYALALQMGMAHPVFGRGLSAFTMTGWPYAHNIFLEAFCETGLIGVVLLVIPLSCFAYNQLTHWSRLESATTAGWVLMFVAAQFSGDLYDSRLVFILLPLAGIGTRLSPRRGPGQPESGVSSVP